MKIALTGSSGILGSSIKNYCYEKKINCKVLSKNAYRDEWQRETIKEELRNATVSVCIHCAANTNVEQCEEFPENCYRDNCALTEFLATECQSLGIKFVFISSTGIYGLGKKSPYIEVDEINPTTVHHKAKWHAEQAIGRIISNHLIIRTGWLFGGCWDSPKNFVANRIREAQKEPVCIKSDESQFGCPTYADDVTSCIFKLLSLDANGTFNCVNEGSASRYEYVKAILEISKSKAIVVPVDGEFFDRKAKVSWNEMAKNKRLIDMTNASLPYWRQSLEIYLMKHRDQWFQN